MEVVGLCAAWISYGAGVQGIYAVPERNDLIQETRRKGVCIDADKSCSDIFHCEYQMLALFPQYSGVCTCIFYLFHSHQCRLELGSIYRLGGRVRVYGEALKPGKDH